LLVRTTDGILYI